MTIVFTMKYSAQSMRSVIRTSETEKYLSGLSELTFAAAVLYCKEMLLNTQSMMSFLSSNM